MDFTRISMDVEMLNLGDNCALEIVYSSCALLDGTRSSAVLQRWVHCRQIQHPPDTILPRWNYRVMLSQ
uniref:Uncharacterized protein n=1 Tax=Arundo donax TaxID=35708 RepID=A0A0A9FRA4_ARUDO